MSVGTQVSLSHGATRVGLSPRSSSGTSSVLTALSFRRFCHRVVARRLVDFFAGSTTRPATWRRCAYPPTAVGTPPLPLVHMLTALLEERGIQRPNNGPTHTHMSPCHHASCCCTRFEHVGLACGQPPLRPRSVPRPGPCRQQQRRTGICRNTAGSRSVTYQTWPHPSTQLCAQTARSPITPPG